MKYSINKTTVFIVTGLLIVGWGTAIISNSNGFSLSFFPIFAISFVLFVFFDMLFGTYVELNDRFLCQTDYFFMKKKISLGEIEVVRYQPSFGFGKAVSSLYIFEKSRSMATVVMSNTWFTEKTLSQVIRDLKKTNSAIALDSEAEELMKKYVGKWGVGEWG